MNIRNEILDKWQAIQDVDEERKLFKEYADIRDEYLEGLKKHARGEISDVSFEKLYIKEKNSLLEYLNCRLKIKL